MKPNHIYERDEAYIAYYACFDLNDNDCSFETDYRYFDCDCDSDGTGNYIHLKEEEDTCPVCGYHHEESPASRVDELEFFFPHSSF